MADDIEKTRMCLLREDIESDENLLNKKKAFLHALEAFMKDGFVIDDCDFDAWENALLYAYTCNARSEHFFKKENIKKLDEFAEYFKNEVIKIGLEYD